MSEKFVPPESEEGWALTVPFEVTMTISWGLKLPMDWPLTVLPLKLTVPKSARGRTPLPLEGASAITSAEASLALRNVLVVWKVHP